MIDYFALMQHLPLILVMTAICGLLFGVPYLIQKMLHKNESDDDS